MSLTSATLILLSQLTSLAFGYSHKLTEKKRIYANTKMDWFDILMLNQTGLMGIKILVVVINPNYEDTRYSCHTMRVQELWSTTY